MKNLDASAKRNSSLWYGWKIRLVWLAAPFVGMFATNVKAWCRNWATARAYRLGRADGGLSPYAAFLANRGPDRRIRQWRIRFLADNRAR